MKKYFIPICVITLFTAACTNNQRQNKIPKNLMGIWVPKNIKWDFYDSEPSSGIPTHKEASVSLLNFLPDNEAKIIYTTISLNNNDSLNTQVDIHCNRFTWSENNNKVSLSGLNSKSTVINIVTSNDTLFNVTLNNIQYVRTNMFDKWSASEIKNCPLKSNP